MLLIFQYCLLTIEGLQNQIISGQFGQFLFQIRYICLGQCIYSFFRSSGLGQFEKFNVVILLFHPEIL